MRQIDSEEVYANALAEIERMLCDEPIPGTAEGKAFKALCDAVEAYEAIYWPIEPTPALKFGM